MRTLTLTRKKDNRFFDVLVDDQDWGSIEAYYWNIEEIQTAGESIFYAGRRCGNRRLRMHRQVLGLSDSTIEVDHVNGNGLDNRRENLRSSTRSENQRNRGVVAGISKFKGVNFDNGWRARIALGDQRLHLGRFQTEEEAALAYDEAALKHFGEFARCNFS